MLNYTERSLRPDKGAGRISSREPERNRGEGNSAMNKKIKTEAVDHLFQAILTLETQEECYSLRMYVR